MDNNEFFAALALMEKEKGIPAEFLADKIMQAIVVAVKRDYNGKDIVYCNIDCDKQTFDVSIRKDVVDEIEDDDTQILVANAQSYKKSAKAGDVLEIKLETKNFGRIIAQTAKHVIRQGIREAERGQTLADFQDKNQELVSAKVLRVDPKTGNATIEIGRNEAVLPKSEQVPDEEIIEGEFIKVFIVDVKTSEKGPKAMVSRTHPGLVKRLFEMEVPEIFDGIIEIKSISREAGSRTKLAVFSSDDNVDAVGSCIGPRGARVNKIVDELNGEKIDIINYSEVPEEFIAEAMSPAKVIAVDIDPQGAKSCHVAVPDSQLSLAIGNKGQNARLAAKLTGWKIDIKPESTYYLEQGITITSEE